MVGINYGVKYQSFIPIYIYSILKSYPEYEVLVFSDTSMDARIVNSLDKLRNLGTFEIVENYNFGFTNPRRGIDSSIFNMAARWFIYDDRFLNYDSIYIGDLDILVCREESGIYEQHKKHCEVIGLPYSNCVRCSVSTSKLSIKLILYYLLTFQFKILKKKLSSRGKIRNKLTGLHFILCEEYFKKLVPVKNQILHELCEEALNWETDQEIIYELMKRSNIGIPKISPSSPVMESKNCDSIGYRPHHGIHLGIFRNKLNVKKEIQLLNSYTYKEYYMKYLEMKEDPLFIELINNSDEFVRNLFHEMERFYDNDSE